VKKLEKEVVERAIDESIKMIRLIVEFF
jgi:hypothetical protein